ncbi:MAG: HIT family protein [Defluviitaleaceae bacterium]|nr:HIT family protein [Defluviitaleaceae bacterium]
MDCIFCKIVEGTIPSYTIYEDDLFKVFLDIAPGALGHALIIPKTHCTDVFDLPEKYAANIFGVAQKVTEILKTTLGCDGFNIIQNNDASAGQTVFHFHTHIIPRYKNDGLKIGWTPLSPTQEELIKTHKTIKAGVIS